MAKAFRAENRGSVLMVGRSGGPEERAVPEAGFELETVNVRGLDRDALWKNVALPYLIPAALRAGLRIVDRFQPDVVLGMGGYVMAPAVAAARMRRIPYVLHEKDVRPGLATRMFAGGAACVCTTLPGTEKSLKAPRIVQTGVPLRDGFDPRSPNVPPRVLLVTGGSQGARNLNQTVWAALDELTRRYEQVIHVAGRQGESGVAVHERRRYLGMSFTEDMAGLMAQADLVVCRAGVGTIAEATAVGLPMVLVPGTFGGAHQEANAAAMVEAGAAVRIPDRDLTPKRLLDVLDSFDPERLRAMAKASAAAGRRDAAERVLRVLDEVAGEVRG
ncbi:MAG TPA: UDP-N-acetylglucosamine--N-acetylmuramyl-(pentapeptide) pyrophosphoryl-undecaprenol N-acetylglucosamine transferase [Candidatus Dormibacteraeota bacterium]|nr:UDP-N-acetylglucosamine--N-acetylmuramyl-(pentapeptide) pyrophosphoryl-undecaprenol N-acetylglucosamine transferase [Candidatus Dormibacteraeota bacterium]